MVDYKSHDEIHSNMLTLSNLSNRLKTRVYSADSMMVAMTSECEIALGIAWDVCVDLCSNCVKG